MAGNSILQPPNLPNSQILADDTIPAPTGNLNNAGDATINPTLPATPTGPSNSMNAIA